MQNPFRARALSRRRIVLAMALAMAADGIQMALGPLGWTFFDEIIDVVVMILNCLLLGFHPLLLPTFLVELIPVVDMLPTWTACVGAVILLRKRQQASAAPTVAPSPPPPANADDKDSPIIDV